MQDTYIKLDRSLLQHRYFDNVNVLKVWLWCLMKASHAEHKRLVGMQTVELKTGQFVTGRFAASKDLKLPASTAWTILKLFEKDGKISINSNNKYSVISVIDFYTYQVVKYPSRQQPDSRLTATEQHLDTNNNGNKGNNGENENHNTLPASGDADHHQDEPFLFSKKKRKITGKRLASFNLFWDAFNYKKGKAEAVDAWLDIPGMTGAMVCKIVAAAKREADVRPAQLAAKRTPKMAQGWLSGRRWEDEHCELTRKGSDDDIERALFSPGEETQ